MLTVKKSRIITLLLAMTLILTFMFGVFGQAPIIYADEITDLEQKIKDLETQSKQIDSQLSDLKGKLESEEENQVVLKARIKNTTDQITLYNQKIDAMTASIQQKNKEIDEKSEDIYANEELFAQRLRGMYISNASSSTLTYILGAKSFSEILTRAEIIRKISESDTELIQTLTDEKAELNAIKKDMEEQNAALTQTKANLKARSDELVTLKAQSEANEKSLLKTQETYYKQKQTFKKQIEANEKEIDRILAERANKGQAPEGQYKWPVPSSSRITSPFGWRTIWGKKEWHTGIDIGAKAGSAIVAAQPGTVVAANKLSYGYGWHLVIDHGGGHATLYAHCSRLDVKVGDQVQRGDVIAGVGTTGASTGNHLHFEVRINGEKKNPTGYVVAPN